MANLYAKLGVALADLEPCQKAQPYLDGLIRRCAEYAKQKPIHAQNRVAFYLVRDDFLRFTSLQSPRLELTEVDAIFEEMVRQFKQL